MGKYIPVEPEKWAEMVKAMAEVTRLKAEVERLTQNTDKLCKHGDLEIERLKAEVERLKKFNDEALAHIAKEERKSRDRLDMVQAEVERLRKAGDALYESEIGYYGEQILVDPKHHSGELCRNWNAAKEGKQP